jgi:hypothetical protein
MSVRPRRQIEVGYAVGDLGEDLASALEQLTDQVERLALATERIATAVEALAKQGQPWQGNGVPAPRAPWETRADREPWQRRAAA